LSAKPLAFPWDGIGPFLLSAYHDDADEPRPGRG
jgi:hypothetical protein